MNEFINKLIERLEETRWTTNFDTSCIFANSKLDKCIEIVNQLAEEYINTSTEHINCSTGWIPCSERLPKEGQCVLVQVRYTQQLDTEDETPIQIRKYETKHERYSWKQIGYDEWLMDDIVIAWMPLPPAYQPKGE